MKIKTRSTFPIGSTDHLRAKHPSGKDLKAEVEPGTNVEALPRKLPALGPAESFDDTMIHVFVNGKHRGFDYVPGPGDLMDLQVPVSGG